jgi:hypothetical protein
MSVALLFGVVSGNGEEIPDGLAVLALLLVGGVVDVLADGLEGGVEFSHSNGDGGDVLRFVGVFQLSEGGFKFDGQK